MLLAQYRCRKIADIFSDIGATRRACTCCSGVSLEIIRDFLGHVDVKTTQIYARANLEMKRRALEKVADAALPTTPSCQQNKTLLDWLHSL